MAAEAARSPRMRRVDGCLPGRSDASTLVSRLPVPFLMRWKVRDKQRGMRGVSQPSYVRVQHDKRGAGGKSSYIFHST